MNPRISPYIFLLVILTVNLTAQEPLSVGHDPTLFGDPLPYHKVEGVDQCMAAEVEGDRLYAVGGGSLYVLDITTPESPKLLGELGGLGNTRQLVIRDGIAYITARADGLWMVDVSDSNKPTLISHYDTVEMATGICVTGRIACIATRCYGVEIVDISDPTEVRHLSTLKTGEAQSCWTRDGYLYIGDWAPKKLLIADIKDPRNPVIVGEGLLDGYGDGGCIRGNYCFAATGHHSRLDKEVETEGNGHGLEIFDVSKPTEPNFVSRVKFPPFYYLFSDMWTARVAGEQCIVADTVNGVFVVDFHDIEKPVITGHAQLPWVKDREVFDPVGGIALAKGVIYAAGIHTGLYVISNPGLTSLDSPEPDRAPVLVTELKKESGNPDFQDYRPEGQVRSVTVDGDVAWAACGAAGVQAIRLGDEMNPIAKHEVDGEVLHVSLSGNRLITSEGSNGMGIYDIGADFSLTEVGRLHVPGQSVKQAAAPDPGQFAILHCGGPTIYVADLTDPTQPKLALTDSQIGLFYGDQLVDRLFDKQYLAAHWHRSGPAWYDISGPTPVLSGNTPDESRYSWTDGACAFGEKMLIVKRGNYVVLDANEQRSVSDLPAISVEGCYLVGRPTISGNLLAVASRHFSKVSVIDIEDISRPKLIHKYQLSGHPGACSFWNGRLVIPAGYQGLLLAREQ